MEIVENVTAWGGPGDDRQITGTRFQLDGDVEFQLFDPVEHRIYRFTRSEFEELWFTKRSGGDGGGSSSGSDRTGGEVPH